MISDFVHKNEVRFVALRRYITLNYNMLFKVYVNMKKIGLYKEKLEELKQTIERKLENLRKVSPKKEMC